MPRTSGAVTLVFRCFACPRVCRKTLNPRWLRHATFRAATELTSPTVFNFALINPAPTAGPSSSLALPIVEPSPTPFQLTPSRTLVGTSPVPVTITGAGFIPASTVLIDGNPHATTFVSTTQLAFTLSPAEIATTATRQVAVSNPMPGGGSSAPLAFQIENPAPSNLTLNPATYAARSPDTTVNLLGINFVPSSIVSVDAIPRATTFVDPTHLTITLTAAELATQGTHTLSVSTPAPGGGSSNAVTYAVTAPAWQGKTIAAFGDDSFAWRNAPAAIATALGANLKWSSSQNGRTLHDIFVNYTGNSPLGVSDGTYTPIGNTLPQDLAGVDLVLIDLGINDLTATSVLGTYSDPPTSSTLVGLIRRALEAIFTANPSVRVVWVSPYDMLSRPYASPTGPIISTLQLVCQDYGVPVLDMGTNSGITSYNSYATSAGIYGTIGFLDGDGTHLSALGQAQLFVPYITRALALYSPVLP